MTDNKKQLSVAIIQMKQEQGDVAYNTNRLNQMILGQLPPGRTVDLLLLPEMWNTGFMTTAEGLSAAELSGVFEQGRQTMTELAAKYDCAVYGSLIEPLADGSLSNTGLFVTPDGVLASYRKRHLFGPGGERKYFTSGHDRVQVEWRGWRMRLHICYDLRFPVWMRQSSDQDDQYDLLLNSANWPDIRIDAWDILLKARAVENQSYVIGINRTGDGPKGLRYPGWSMALDPKGVIIADGKSGDEAMICCTLDKEPLEVFRSKFPVLREVDEYQFLDQ